MSGLFDEAQMNEVGLDPVIGIGGKAFTISPSPHELSRNTLVVEELNRSVEASYLSRIRGMHVSVIEYYNGGAVYAESSPEIFIARLRSEVVGISGRPNHCVGEVSEGGVWLTRPR